MRSRVDARLLESTVKATREANAVIDERTFSWTALFNVFERTIPSEVRLRAVTPANDRGVLLVRFTVNTPRVEPVGLFLDRLEAAGAFAGLRSVEEQGRRRRNLQRRVRGAVPRARDGDGRRRDGSRRTAAPPAAPQRARGRTDMVPTARILADRRLLVSVLALARDRELRRPGSGRRADSFARAHADPARHDRVAVGLHRDARTADAQTDDGRQRAGGDRPAAVLHAGPAGQSARRAAGHARTAGAVDARGATCRTTVARFAQEEPEKDAVLTRATLTMSVYGSYRNLRQFLYKLETGPDFIVVREVGVAQADDPQEPLEAALTLSTYFKASRWPLTRAGSFRC